MKRNIIKTEDGDELETTEVDETPIGALKLLVEAVESAKAEGSIDHLDCCADGGALFWGALNNARQVLKANGQ